MEARCCRIRLEQGSCAAAGLVQTVGHPQRVSAGLDGCPIPMTVFHSLITRQELAAPLRLRSASRFLFSSSFDSLDPARERKILPLCARVSPALVIGNSISILAILRGTEEGFKASSFQNESTRGETRS